MTTSQEEQALELGDWGAFLHEQVRSPELRRLPPEAKTVLSGGQGSVGGTDRGSS